MFFYTNDLSISVFPMCQHGGDDAKVVLGLSRQIGGTSEDRVAVATIYLDKDEVKGLIKTLTTRLKQWPQPKGGGPDQYSKPYAKELSPHAHKEPVEPASKEAPG